MPLILAPLFESASAARPAVGPLSIDLDGIVPDRVQDLDRAGIQRLAIQADGRPCALGELFDVSGDVADGRIECRGDFSRVHRVGAGMAAGRIHVAGDAGRHAGAGMQGGGLTIAGDAGDWLAAEMSGGEVTVAGNAGDNAAAALPGAAVGMRGGLVVIGGSTGSLAGSRMRRGILAIGGDCGPAAAFELRAGTVLIGGSVGPRAALGMRRGSLIAVSAAPVLPPGFVRGACWMPAFLPILFRRLERAGFRPGLPSGIAGIPLRQWHGDALAGGRGEVWAAADPDRSGQESGFRKG